VTSPPATIDGASVLKFADLSHATATGRTKHVVRGHRPRDFAALAIATYGIASGFYLFYCDAEWRAVTDTYHDTIDAAIAQAEFEFAGVSFEDAAG
jgi:hypothetical protein